MESSLNKKVVTFLKIFKVRIIGANIERIYNTDNIMQKQECILYTPTLRVDSLIYNVDKFT